MSVVRWTLGVAVMALFAVPAMAQSSIQTAFNYNLDDTAIADPAAPDYAAEGCADAGAGYACAEPTCGCESGYCSCGSSGWGNCLGDCCLGEAWTLKSCLSPCCETNYGGWLQFGYHTHTTRLSQERGDLFAFNDVPHNINLHQAWLYVERVAEAGACSSDWGYRVDVVYGTDAQKTQAFGNPGGRWDTTFDHGVYGWAIPQAYVEYASGDWSVKVGHFFTLVGYEVVTAPDNFFYSHALTMFNSEPFTHTGVISTYSASDDVTLYAGWTLGWDTGFDQFNAGNSWLGGFSTGLSDDVTFTYISTAGNLGWRGEGYSHSTVFDVALSPCMNYVLQSDYVNTEFPDGFDNEDVGINQYLFYTLNDCWSVGGRYEWWKSNNPTDFAQSFHEVTGGINYKPHANVVVRPEIRYDWTNESGATDGYNQTVFGVDAILLL